MLSVISNHPETPFQKNRSVIIQFIFSSIGHFHVLIEALFQLVAEVVRKFSDSIDRVGLLKM